MTSLGFNFGYMLIYKFDDISQLNRSIQQIDDRTILCPYSKILFFRNKFNWIIFIDLTNDNLLTYFIDNNKTVGHQSTFFDIRQLNLTEFEMYCRNMSKNILITDDVFNFPSDYELRIFTSGCYYRDFNNSWLSNGLLVTLEKETV